MQKNFCKQMRLSGPEALPLNQQFKFDVLINIETLSGCEHNCVGCFVDKNLDTKTNDNILKRALELSNSIKEHNLNLREFVIGPTDFFSAKNIKHILNHKITQKIMFDHKNARIANASRFDQTSMDKIKDIFSILDDTTKYREDMIIEFIQPLPKNLLQIVDDKEYFDTVMERIDFFKNQTPKNIDWSWALQSSGILANKLSKEDYTKILVKTLDDYETILEMIPAFTRASSPEIQKRNLLEWNNFLSRVIDEKNSKKVVMSMANIYFNSFNFIGLSIYPGKNGEAKTILNVMLHEQAMFTHNPNLDVTGLSFEEILTRREELITKGIKKFSEHPLYKDNPHVHGLAHKLVWEAIESMDFKENEEIIPLDILSLYNPLDHRDYTFNDDANKIRGDR